MQIFVFFFFTLIIPCAFCGNEKTMKNGEKKSQEVGPSKANVLKTAVVGVLALGGGIGLANGAQPAASGASFNNNLTSATNQHLFKPSTGYEPPPMKPFVEFKQPEEPSQSPTTSDERRQLFVRKRHHHRSSATKPKTPFSYLF